MLEKIKVLLGLKQTNEQIETILEIVTDRLLAKLKMLTGASVEEVPEELESVVVEICVNRYNRIGSEGTTSHNVEGESLQFGSTDYFKPYEADIAAWAAMQKQDTAPLHIGFL